MPPSAVSIPIPRLRPRPAVVCHAVLTPRRAVCPVEAAPPDPSAAIKVLESRPAAALQELVRTMPLSVAQLAVEATQGDLRPGRSAAGGPILLCFFVCLD